MENPLLTKSYVAGAAVNPYRILKWDAADRKVVHAAGATDRLIGISAGAKAIASGFRVEVVRAGLKEVEYGGTVTRGQPLTSDATGRAVAAVLDPVAPPNIIGIAEESGVVGDIRPCLIVPCPSFASGGVADVTVTSAELLALNATPKTLIAAPGAGLAIIPTLIALFLDYNSAAYAGIAAGEDLAAKYTDASGATLATIEATGFLDATADAVRAIFPVTTLLTPVANAALVLHMLTGEIITGNSPLKVKVHYKVIETAW